MAGTSPAMTVQMDGAARIAAGTPQIQRNLIANLMG